MFSLIKTPVDYYFYGTLLLQCSKAMNTLFKEKFKIFTDQFNYQQSKYKILQGGNLEGPYPSRYGFMLSTMFVYLINIWPGILHIIYTTWLFDKDVKKQILVVENRIPYTSLIYKVSSSCTMLRFLGKIGNKKRTVVSTF